MSCHNLDSDDAPAAIYISNGNLNPFQKRTSSIVGTVEHFSEIFEKTDVEAALAAGILHREEVPIEERS